MDRDDRDDVMLEERLAGRSARAIAKRHRCSSSEVEAVVDRRLDYVLDHSRRRRRAATCRPARCVASFWKGAACCSG